MNGQRLLSWLVAVWRGVSGRGARRAYTVAFLTCLALSAVLRCRSYLLTRRIQAVLAGLAQLRVDRTTEGQLQMLVPYLRSHEIQTASGVERQYCVNITNDGDGRGMRYAMRWVPESFFSLRRPRPAERPIQDKWAAMELPFKVAYVLGWRHLTFGACVTIWNGVVSGTSYNLEPDVFFGWPASELVLVRSMHGFWTRNKSMAIKSVDDENPDFRFGAVAGQFSWLAGSDSAIAVAFTANAPRELISHAFSIDLSCFWDIWGCKSVRQVVPLLWSDQLAIADATAVRLRSENPCPDRIVDGRVRTLPDLNVSLLEVVDSRSQAINDEGDRTQEIVTDYRLREVIRGHPDASEMTAIRYRRRIASPTGEITNPLGPSYPKRGERFLFFSGAHFDSRRIIPATPSAESAVRAAVPAIKRREDQVGWGRS